MTGSMSSVNVSEVKPWYHSRTLWFNLIAAALIALESRFALLQPYLPGNVYAWMATVLTVGNAILRVITAAPLVFGLGNDQSV
jgi:hypothetical protein